LTPAVNGLLVPDPAWDPLGEIFVENEFNKNPITPSIRGCPKKFLQGIS